MRLPERQHQAGGEDRESGPERTHVDELAPREKKCADDHAGRGKDRSSGANQRLEPVGRQTAGEAAAPTQVDDRREKDAERGEDEPDQLWVLMAVSLPRGALLLAHAGGRARLQ